MTAITLEWCHAVDLNMSLGHDLDDISMVTSTLQHSHQSLRKQAAGAWEEKNVCPLESFVLHWDVKMFPEIRGGRYMDRMAVLVIGYVHEKLPNVSDGTGGRLSPFVH